MAFSDTSPKLGDSDHNLLFKIAQMFNDQNSGNNPPKLGDSKNNLLFKIAKSLNGE